MRCHRPALTGAVQYSASYIVETNSRHGLLDAPLEAGHDREACVAAWWRYSPTKASSVPLPEAGGTQIAPALRMPVAPNAFSAAARSAAITSPAPPRSGRPASDTLG